MIISWMLISFIIIAQLIYLTLTTYFQL